MRADILELVQMGFVDWFYIESKEFELLVPDGGPSCGWLREDAVFPV
jgi:hypothetical protein